MRAAKVVLVWLTLTRASGVVSRPVTRPLGAPDSRCPIQGVCQCLSVSCPMTFSKRCFLRARYVFYVTRNRVFLQTCRFRGSFRSSYAMIGIINVNDTTATEFMAAPRLAPRPIIEESAQSTFSNEHAKLSRQRTNNLSIFHRRRFSTQVGYLEDGRKLYNGQLVEVSGCMNVRTANN